LEIDTLGPEHAREHALLRALAREHPPQPDGAVLASSAGSEALFSPEPIGAGFVSATGFDCSADDTAPQCAGAWGTPFSIPVMAISAVLLPTGKVLWWAYPENPNPGFGNPDAPNTAQAWLWEPSSGNTKRVDPPLWRDPADGQLKPANIWCSGQSLLSDGRVVVAGGNLAYPDNGDDYKGLNKVFTFNPWSETWTEQPDMEHGRWYPSVARLPDGRTVIMSGFDESGDGYASTNRQIDVFQPSGALNGVGTVMAIPGERRKEGPDNGYPPNGGLYPHLFSMPSGRLLVAGPDPNDSWYLNGADTSVDLSRQWEPLADGPPQRLWGSGVLVPPPPGEVAPSSKVELIGGSDLAVSDSSVPTSTVYDESDPDAGWHPGPSLNIGRGHLNTVLLPDGSMVTIGGGVGRDTSSTDLWASTPERKRVELFDPVTETWRLGAAQQEYRAYHSTALLLPDGRVVSAGDDYNGGIDQDTAEIYSPPYLFQGLGSRPVIDQAPLTAAYDTPFDVDYHGPGVVRAALVAPGATTHANDMNQRWVPLELTAGPPGTVSLEVPGGAAESAMNAAPPGWYMLFLLSGDGVPSVASWILVGRDLPPDAVGPPPSGGNPEAPEGDGPIEQQAEQPDLMGPLVTFDPARGVGPHLNLLHGSVRDPSGTRLVRVAVALREGRRCEWWSSRLRRLGGLSSCGRPVFLSARMKAAGSPAGWVARLGGSLAPGRYLVVVDAVDRKGNKARTMRVPIVVGSPS